MFNMAEKTRDEKAVSAIKFDMKFLLVAIVLSLALQLLMVAKALIWPAREIDLTFLIVASMLTALWVGYRQEYHELKYHGTTT